MAGGAAEPRMEAAFPRMMAIDIICHSRAVSLQSPVALDISLPSSTKNLDAAEPTTPDVSTATGTKMYCEEMKEYLCIFRASAARAADPGLREQATKTLSEKVSVQVESRARHFRWQMGRLET